MIAFRTAAAMALACAAMSAGSALAAADCQPAGLTPLERRIADAAADGPAEMRRLIARLQYIHQLDMRASTEAGMRHHTARERCLAANGGARPRTRDAG